MKSPVPIGSATVDDGECGSNPLVLLYESGAMIEVVGTQKNVIKRSGDFLRCPGTRGARMALPVIATNSLREIT